MEEFRSAQGTPVQDECTVVNDQMHSLNLQDAPNSGKRILVQEGQHLTLIGEVGFHKLPEQVTAKSKGRGFDLNVLILGGESCGKSTFIETLFNVSTDELELIDGNGAIEIWRKTIDIEENNVRFRLTIAEGRGLGKGLKCTNRHAVLRHEPIVEYIESQYDQFFKMEKRTVRVRNELHDNRIHACIYMLDATGHGLRDLDIAVMRELCHRVNLVPVIAKADSMNVADREENKAKILRDLKANNIACYTLPVEDEPSLDEDTLLLNRKLQSMIPFAVCGSREVDEQGQHVRRYPWGTVVAEWEEHSDLKALRDALICVNMTDLWKKTHNLFYAKFRSEHKPKFTEDGDSANSSHAELDESQKRDLLGMREDEVRKMEQKHQDIREEFAERLRVLEEKMQHTQENMNNEYVPEITRLEEQLQFYTDKKNSAIFDLNEAQLASPKSFAKKKLLHKPSFFRTHSNSSNGAP